MKNTVYSVARGSKAATIEAFAMELGDYLLDNNPQVSKCQHRDRRESLGAHDQSTARPKPRPSSWAGRSCRPCAPCANRGRRVVHHIRRGWTDDSQNHQVGIHRLHQRQADHAQAGHRSHLRHPRDRRRGITPATAPDYAQAARTHSSPRCSRHLPRTTA